MPAIVLAVSKAVAVAALPVVSWLSVGILAAASVPEEMFDAFVVSVVAEVAKPAIFEAAIAALAFISALTIVPSTIFAEVTVLFDGVPTPRRP